MQRDAQGKFTLKNDEHRSVRSLRLTDATWSALGALADSRALTKADLLEQIFDNSDHSFPSNTRLTRNLYQVIRGQRMSFYRVIHGSKRKYDSL